MELEEAKQILIDLNIDPDKVAQDGKSMMEKIMANADVVNQNDFISDVSKCDFCGSNELVEGETHCNPCSVLRVY